MLWHTDQSAACTANFPLDKTNMKKNSFAQTRFVVG